MSKRMQCKRSFEIIFFKYKNNRIFQKYLYSQQICSEGNLLIVYVVWVEVGDGGWKSGTCNCEHRDKKRKLCSSCLKGPLQSSQNSIQKEGLEHISFKRTIKLYLISYILSQTIIDYDRDARGGAFHSLTRGAVWGKEKNPGGSHVGQRKRCQRI